MYFSGLFSLNSVFIIIVISPERLEVLDNNFGASGAFESIDPDGNFFNEIFDSVDGNSQSKYFGIDAL